MSNNQKLIQNNLCMGTGSCESSHILLSTAVELCIKVSTPGCSHYDHWQTHLQQILITCYLLLSQAGSFLTCQLQESSISLHLSHTLAYVPRKTNTGYEAPDSV